MQMASSACCLGLASHMVSLWQNGLDFFIAQFQASRRTSLNVQVLFKPLLCYTSWCLITEASPEFSSRVVCKAWRLKALAHRGLSLIATICPLAPNGSQPSHRKNTLTSPTAPESDLIMGQVRAWSLERTRLLRLFGVVPECRALWTKDKWLSLHPPIYSGDTEWDICSGHILHMLWGCV